MHITCVCKHPRYALYNRPPEFSLFAHLCFLFLCFNRNLSFLEGTYVRHVTKTNENLLSCNKLDKNKMPLISDVNMALSNGRSNMIRVI